MESRRGASLALLLCTGGALLLLAVGTAAAAQPYPHSGLHRFFHERMDGNHDGRVTVSELVRYLHSMDDDMVVEETAVRALVRRIDTDGDQVWTWAEFQAAHAELDRESQPVASSVSPRQVHIALTGTPLPTHAVEWTALHRPVVFRPREKDVRACETDD